MEPANPNKISTWQGTLMGTLWKVRHYMTRSCRRSPGRKEWTNRHMFYPALSVYCANPGFQAVPVIAGSRHPESGNVEVKSSCGAKTEYFGRILGPVFFGWPDLRGKANKDLLKYEVMHFSRAPLEKEQAKDRLSAAEAEQLRYFLKAKDLL